MEVTTEGIVLKQIKYGDSDCIVKIYTRLFGLQSFMIKGLRKQGGKQKTAMFLPLSQVEFSTRIKPNSLSYLKDCKLSNVYKSLYFDIKKSTIALFLADILSKVILIEGEKDEKLYEFISNTLSLFDSIAEEKVADFHLNFLLDLSKYLGIPPNTEKEHNSNYFDLREACFVYNKPYHSDYIEEEECRAFKIFIENRRSQYLQHRQLLLKTFTNYYKIQLSMPYDIESYKVLQEVFS